MHKLFTALCAVLVTCSSAIVLAGNSSADRGPVSNGPSDTSGVGPDSTARTNVPGAGADTADDAGKSMNDTDAIGNDSRTSTGKRTRDGGNSGVHPAPPNSNSTR